MGDIIHWNIRGIKDKRNLNFFKKVETVVALLKQPQNNLIINIQETHLTQNLQIPRKWLNFEHLYSIISAHAVETDRFGGIILFINKTLEILETEILIDGRILFVKARNKVTLEIFYYISFYGKASGTVLERSNVLKCAISKIESNNYENVFLFGDFNFVTSVLDRNSKKLTDYDKVCKQIWDKFEVTSNLIDTYRVSHKNRCLYTYSSPSNSKCRIDRLYVPVNVSGKIISVSFTESQVSDHKITTTKFSKTIKKGKGHYILNNTLLEDPVYIEKVKEIIQDFKDNVDDYGSYRLAWDFLKMAIASFSQNYSIEKKKIESLVVYRAKDVIKCIESIPKQNLSKPLVDKLKINESIIYKYENKKLAGAILRSKVTVFEQNEVNISYISNLEKLKGDSNTISSLLDKNGVLKEGSENVLQIAQEFYKSLYTKDAENQLDQNYFLRNINKHTTIEEREELDLPLSENEVFSALSDLKKNKSPGDDSLTVEFYLCFWVELKSMYLRCLNEIRIHKELSSSQKRGLITIIYKKYERYKIENYRPISLLNVDLKIITRALAKRMAKVTEKLIRGNQKCIPGRRITENLHILQDLIDKINKNDDAAAIIFLDQQKAFDRMSHSFVIKTLRHFGFGENFIQWVKIIYNNCNARVKVNGFTSDSFAIKRGVRQGCPLSSLLYVLCAETLSLEINNNVEILGIKIREQQHKDLEYADDMSIAITSMGSLDVVFDVLNRYEKATNAKINVNKTEALWVGKWKNRTDKPKDLKWSNSSIKSLGVYIGNNREEAGSIGFEEIKEKIKNKLKFWKGKGISLKGKIRVLNTFVLTKLWYACEIHDIPIHIRDEINQMIKVFFWDGKYHQRSLEGLTEDYAQGGLRLASIEKKINTLRINWLCSLMKRGTHTIEHILANELISDNNLKLGYDILKGYESNQIKTISNRFYRNACLAWNNSKIRFVPKNRDSINNLWLYDNILLKDDEGRSFKPPKYFGSIRNQRNMPNTFGDLPFPLINRNVNDSRIIRSINKSFGKIEWGTHNYFSIKIQGVETPLADLISKQIYWSLFARSIDYPWKRKWNNIIEIHENSWKYIWENVHDTYLPYKIQSSLWEMVNLNFISSYRLNIMYNKSKACLNCQEDEEGPAHTFLFCDISNQVYNHFMVLLMKFSNKGLDMKEKCFGIFLESVESKKKERLRNYILSLIKHTIFKKRANQAHLPKEGISLFLINLCKKLITKDLNSKYIIASKNKKIQIFKDNFLMEGILGNIDQSTLKIYI